MRIGIFGGSFNPIHTGHAIIASHIIKSGTVDELWLMVAPQNPLKHPIDPELDEHRLVMANMVAQRIPGVKVSDLEFSLPRPSYSIATLDALAQAYPDEQFLLVIGSDNWQIFGNWRESQRIINQYGLIVYPRPGYNTIIPPYLSERVSLVNAPLIEISSTAIRQMLANGQDASFFLPDDVNQYAINNHLYEQRYN